MSTNLDHRASESTEMKDSASGTDLTLDSVIRRRVLLKNIGKGAAALAATVPVQTLAQGTALLTTDGNRCSVSGMQSGVHSQSPDSSVICGGYSPGWWQQNNNEKAKNWPQSVNPDASYKSVFPKASLPKLNGVDPTLWEVMSHNGQGNYKNTDMFHWIGAWLNGVEQRNNFPYNNVEIAALYDDEKTRVPALELIKTYLEIHGSAP